MGELKVQVTAIIDLGPDAIEMMSGGHLQGVFAKCVVEIERLEAEVERLEKQCESLQNKWASRELSQQDSDDLMAENERLRDALREIRDRQVSAWQMRVIDKALSVNTCSP